MLRIKFTYFDLLTPSNPLNGDYYFASEALDYDNIYWEPRIIDPFDIERFFDVQSDTTNRIRTAQISLDNSDGFLNQFMTKTTTFLNNFMTLYYDNGNGVTKTFTGRVQSIDSVSSSVKLTLREFGYEYLENTFPDAQIAYDYYSDSGINDSWNCIPIHFGTVKRIPLSWVNSFYSEFIIGSGPILSVDKVYIDDEVAYDATQPNKRYKPTDDSKEIYIRIFRGKGWDADGKRETVVDTYRPETLDPTRETVSGNNVTHISQWGGFAYIQLFSIDDNGYEIPAYPYNTDGALGQVYVDIRGITRITKSGNNYTYTNTMVRNPAEIIKLMFCQPELVSEGPCAIGWGYKDSDVNFSQAITDCNNLGFVVDGSFDTSGQFVESLKVILQCCRGYIVEEGEKITLKIDKLKDVNTPSAEFDEEGITGFDCNLEEWNEPDLDSQTNRIRLNYDWSQEFKRYNKKPDVNHESPDYKDDNDYDEWLIDAEHNKKVQKWNTEELELKMISDTTTAHKLAIYYLRKKCLQHIQGTLSCANSAAMNLDAGDLIGVKSKQFNWYKNDSGGTDPNKGKVFQITSIKKGDELTDIDFVEYDPAVFIADSRTFNLKERPDKIANLIKPATPKSLTLTATSKEYAGTTICEINGTVVYASNSNKLFATVRYFDYGTSTPANDYTPPADANWITYGNVDSNKFTISGLTPGHWYFIQVYTVNANGSSEPIVNKVKSLGDIVPPGIPTVSHTFTSGRSIGVKIELLNPPTDFRGFMLFKDGTYLTSITTNIHQNKATCEYTDVCEKYKTTYHYKATSYDKWNNISQYSTEIDIATPEDIDLDDITGTIEILQDDIEDTNIRIDEYVSDDVLSVGEKSRLAEDWLAIRDSRYNKVKTEAENHYFHTDYSLYHQDYLDFVNAYEALEAYVDGNGSPINLTPTPPAVLEESRIEGVGSTIKKKFSDYYDLEIKVLSDIDKDNKNRASTIYAECQTPANTSSKLIILPDVVIFTGLRICVKFFNGNTSPGVITLNIKRNISDESGLINGGKLYHSSGIAIPVITFEAGTTITLVLVERVENEQTVQAWEFSDSTILGLGEKELALGGKEFNLGMVNGNRILAETVDTQQLNAQAVTSEKITSEQIFGKDFRTSEDVGETVDNAIVAGIKFNANGIFGYNTQYQTVAINASDGSVRIGSDSVYMSFNQADGLKVVGNISGSSGIIGDVVLDSNGLHSNTIDSTTQQTIYSLGNTGLIARRGNIAGWTITDTSLEASGIHLRSNGLIYGGNYASGVSGWRIDQLGNAEFNSATIRGKIQTAVFEYNKISAIGGQMLLKRASIVVSDSNHVNTATTLYVKDANEFSVGDCFFVKDPEPVTGGMFYGIISAVDTTNNVLTYSIPEDAGAFFSPANGQSVVNYGNPMSGGIMFDGNSPYIDIFKNHTVSLERDYNIYDPILNINAWDSTTASIAEEDGVIDISGEDNHGQAFGGVSVVNDKTGGRIFNFDGVDDYLEITNPPSSSLKNTDGITISINLKLEEVPSTTACIIAGTVGTSYMFGLQTNAGRVVCSIARTSSSSETAKRIDSAQILPLYQLTNLTAVYNYSIGKMYLYINGTLTDKADCFTTPLSIDLDALTIGGKIENTTLTQRLKGQLSFVRIFNKPLTTEEVHVIYKQSLVTQYINSNMYEPILNLDADYSTTASIAVADGVVDVSGNHNNGQAYGGVVVNNGAYEFNTSSTSSQYIHINKNINWNTSFTINIKCNITDISLTPFLFDCRPIDNSTDNFFIALYASSNPKIRVVFLSNSSNTYVSSTALNLNIDYNITVSLDINTNVLKIYINGILDSTHTVTNKTLVSTTANIIGLNAGLTLSRMIGGQLSNIKIFDRVLSANEVYNVYQQSLNPEAFENPEKLISYDEINVHHFSGDAIQLDHLVRLGNLNGIADITDDRYGIFLGDERSYLKYDSVDGLKLINSNFALDGSILSDNFLWIDGNGNLHDDINMEIASDIEKGITSGQRYTEIGSMINMTTGAFVTPTFRTMSAIGNNPAETHITGNMYFDNDISGVIEPTTDNIITFGSNSKRWKGIYSNYGSFGNVSGMPNSSKVEIGVDANYARGIRIYSGTNGYAGITLCGRDCSSSTGMSANSWCIMNENGAFYLYKNTTAKLSCNASGNWTFNGKIINNGTNGNSSGGGSGVLESSLSSSSYISGYKGVAIINSTASAGAFVMLAKMNSTNGKFMHGVFGQNYQFYYVANSVTTNTITKTCLTINENGTVSAPSGVVGITSGIPSKCIFRINVTGMTATSAAIGTVVPNTGIGGLEFKVAGATANLNSWTNSTTGIGTGTGQHFLVPSGGNIRAESSGITIGTAFTFCAETDTSTSYWANSPAIFEMSTTSDSSNAANRVFIGFNTSRQIRLVICGSDGTSYECHSTLAVANGTSARFGVSVNGNNIIFVHNGVSETATLTNTRVSANMKYFSVGNFYSAPANRQMGHVAFPTLWNQALTAAQMITLLESGFLYDNNSILVSHERITGTLSNNTTGNAATATKLGTSTIGNIATPIYLNAGAPTACTKNFLTAGGTKITTAGWYRVLNLPACITGIVTISKGYNSGEPRFISFFVDNNFSSSKPNARIIATTNSGGNYLTKVRIVWKSNTTCYFEIYVTPTTETWTMMFIPLSGTYAAGAVNFTAGAIPDGYTAYEFAVPNTVGIAPIAGVRSTGSASKPVYVDANGVVQACTSVDLNATTATSATNLLQEYGTGNYNRPILLSNLTNITTTSNQTTSSVFSNKFYANPSTGVLTSTGGFLGQLHAPNSSQITDITTITASTKAINYHADIKNGSTGLFTASNNANAIISIDRHNTSGGKYNSQVGFSSNGNIYYRMFANAVPDSTTAWKQIAFTNSSITGNAASSTYATNIRVTSTQNNNYYYAVGTSGNTASTNYAPAVFPNIVIRDDTNSTSEVFSRLRLGNATAKGTSGGKTGCLTLYGNNTKLCNLLGPEGASADFNVRLPNRAGTLALAGAATQINVTPSGASSAFWSIPLLGTNNGDSSISSAGILYNNAVQKWLSFAPSNGPTGPCILQIGNNGTSSDTYHRGGQLIMYCTSKNVCTRITPSNYDVSVTLPTSDGVIAINSSCDPAIKTDICDVNCLDILKKLSIKRFKYSKKKVNEKQWKRDNPETPLSEMPVFKDNEHEPWYIHGMAQEFNEAFDVDDGNPDEIKPINSIGVCLRAIQELAAQVDELKKQIEELKNNR